MFSWLRNFFRQKSCAGREGSEAKAKAFAKLIRYRFRNRDLLLQALKHRSYLPQVNERRVNSNERLELLGDAVLGLLVTEALYRRYPSKEEGDITAMKSLLVSRKILARFARQLNLGRYVLMSEAEERSGGRTRPSIISDTFEAVIGAIYLDGGIAPARTFVESIVLKEMDDILNEEQHKNFKSLLLEYSQSRNLGVPFYAIRSEEGPDHDKIFTVEVRIQNRIVGVGVGNSKKRAEQNAAQNALEKLHDAAVT
ncbi:MAG: ribonuclease III [candidate division KSB1 bacterium]|nr:ribonuclease III [candidate division KSB1 bacterium]MDZ7301850.1 ribonuclease III [candidate division KSB1 bacterium]MDZ7310233.1 ribonuclease III [candidate division KSB1 bacterium]